MVRVSGHSPTSGVSHRSPIRHDGRDPGADTLLRAAPRIDATSPAVPGVVRRYASFDAFAIDAGEARIFGGMHYRNSIDVGQRQGKSVANWVLGHYLQPLSDDADDDLGGDED